MSIFRKFWEAITQKDVEGLTKAETSYGDSWKKRGGVGAYMMLARKWDRLEEATKKAGWNIFVAIEKDRRAEGIMDDIRDLRRYLTLVEGEMMAQGVIVSEVPKEDNKVGECSKSATGLHAWTRGRVAHPDQTPIEMCSLCGSTRDLKE